jgi:hypothetical protein
MVIGPKAADRKLEIKKMQKTHIFDFVIDILKAPPDLSLVNALWCLWKGRERVSE